MATTPQTPTDGGLAVDLVEAVAAATGGAWRLDRSRVDQGRLSLDCALVTPPDGGPEVVVVEACPAEPGMRAYRVTEGLAFGYRGKDLPRELLAPLDALVDALAATLARRGFDFEPPRAPTTRPAEGGATGDPTFPTPRQRAWLEASAPLPKGAAEAFQRDGHVLVRRALAPDVLNAARPAILEALERSWPDLPPVAERPDAYSQSFTQVSDLWPDEPRLRVVSHAPRIAAMAAELMGVPAVRLFCEDFLVKEPGARITPWHQDALVFPFDPAESITCWIPLRPVGPGDGLMRFARGSHRLELADIEDINEDSEALYDRIIADHGLAIDELPPVWLGDVSFHHGRSIHGAYPNTSDAPRVVLALHMFADGARIKAPTTPKMARLLSFAAPDLKPGDVAESDRWPLVWDARRPERVPRVELAEAPDNTAWHLRATLLPEGREPSDVWIRHGRVSLEPVDGAEDLAAPGGYLCTGLTESHSHISYPTDAGAPVGTTGWMNARRADYAATGVTLLRDMGAVGDEIAALTDVPGLPYVQPCGNMVIPQSDPPFTPTAPEDLVRAFEERIERGSGWVKVFADWTDDYQGRRNTGFTEHDEVAYPAPLLREAVEAARALGGRVAAHCFTRAGAEVAVAAGVDSLEHGWGVDEALAERMAGEGIAWAPLVGIAGHMWRIAHRDGQPDRVDWIERALARMARVIPAADALGVRFVAGTDMFPDVTVADEVRQLRELGLSHKAALAAGTWGAREWLGEPPLASGAPADLVLFRDDPRTDLSALLRPEVVLVGGHRVDATLTNVRPRYVPWSERVPPAPQGGL